MSSHALWILAAIAAVVVALYFITMRVFFAESRELDKKIDLTRMKHWEDDPD